MCSDRGDRNNKACQTIVHRGAGIDRSGLERQDEARSAVTARSAWKRSGSARSPVTPRGRSPLASWRPWSCSWSPAATWAYPRLLPLNSVGMTAYPLTPFALGRVSEPAPPSQRGIAPGEGAPPEPRSSFSEAAPPALRRGTWGVSRSERRAPPSSARNPRKIARLVAPCELPACSLAACYSSDSRVCSRTKLPCWTTSRRTGKRPC